MYCERTLRNLQRGLRAERFLPHSTACSPALCPVHCHPPHRAPLSPCICLEVPPPLVVLSPGVAITATRSDNSLFAQITASFKCCHHPGRRFCHLLGAQRRCSVSSVWICGCRLGAVQVLLSCRLQEAALAGTEGQQKDGSIILCHPRGAQLLSESQRRAMEQ